MLSNARCARAERTRLYVADRASAPTVCIVDDAFVRRFLNGRQAVGTRLEVQAMAQPRATVIREIVGVVAQIEAAR